MNISIKVGYQSIILKDVSANVVDLIMRSKVYDYTYINGVRHDYISNDKIDIIVIATNDIPQLSFDDIENMKLDMENGNQDSVI